MFSPPPEPEQQSGRGPEAGAGAGRGRCNVRKGQEDNYEGLQEEAEVVMGAWCRARSDTRNGGMTAEALTSWLEAYDCVVERSIGWSKVRKGKKKTWYDREVSRWNKEMRMVMEELLRETDDERKSELGERRRKIRSERQRHIRRGRNKRTMEKMREIEKMAATGKDQSLLRSLQEWSGQERSVVGGDRNKMRKDGKPGEWVMGQEMKDKWKETFEGVGRKLGGSTKS